MATKAENIFARGKTYLSKFLSSCSQRNNKRIADATGRWRVKRRRSVAAVPRNWHQERCQMTGSCVEADNEQAVIAFCNAWQRSKRPVDMTNLRLSPRLATPKRPLPGPHADRNCTLNM